MEVTGGLHTSILHRNDGYTVCVPGRHPVPYLLQFAPSVDHHVNRLLVVQHNLSSRCGHCSELIHEELNLVVQYLVSPLEILHRFKCL